MHYKPRRTICKVYKKNCPQWRFAIKPPSCTKKQPLANDHHTDPASCKWSSGGASHLQMIFLSFSPFFCFLFSGTRNIIFRTLKIGQNDLEITNLEFESHGFFENQVFLPTEHAGTNICCIKDTTGSLQKLLSFCYQKTKPNGQ